MLSQLVVCVRDNCLQCPHTLAFSCLQAELHKRKAAFEKGFAAVTTGDGRPSVAKTQGLVASDEEIQAILSSRTDYETLKVSKCLLCPTLNSMLSPHSMPQVLRSNLRSGLM